MLQYSFYKDVEARLPHVLYGDTDSLFINLPTVKINENDLESAYKIISKVAKEINDELADHMNNNVLPLLGIDPQYNRTVFKTEIIVDKIFFTGKKKNYAYRLISKEWNEVKHKPVEYTGLTTKSDMIGKTKEIIHGLIEKIMFNSEYTPEQRSQAAVNYIIQFKDQVINDAKELNIMEIGQRKKWSTKTTSDTFQITGMRLYNTIMEGDPVFKPMMGGIIIPIIITDPINFSKKMNDVKYKNPLYLNDTPVNKINYLCFPYSFDKEIVKERMKYYHIEINAAKIWENICNSQVEDITGLFKQYSNPINQLIGQIK